MTPVAATNASEALSERVQNLLVRWRTETVALSSGSKIVEHPAYQELISLGVAALPFLFRDLEQTSDGHLSKALSAITGARPVPPEDHGRIRRIATAWLQWAKENGYRW